MRPCTSAFGALGTTEQARYLASLYVDDLADVWRLGIDPRFELARYGEKLAASAPTFDPLHEALTGEPTLVDLALDEITRELIEMHRPDVVCITTPFPGNVYGAFRMAQAIRAAAPRTHLVLGGGWVNTELRGLKEPRVFDCFDYVTLDDGERPLLNLLTRLSGRRASLVRTFVRRDGKVLLENDPTQHDVPQRDTGIPTYDGLPLGDYVSVLEMLNPMHRFWSDGRWNKLTLAHGCYWKKCTFCDVSLDYIGRYDKPGTDIILQRIRALVNETGETGFHLVDEAAPPAGMRSLAKQLIDEKLSITWWGNIRFEKTFTPELTALLAQSGCVAVSGGLEVASDRLLQLMKKGVTVEQVARVTRAFADAGILVHAYLMYGFPTETTAGHRRCAGARAPAVCRRLHPFGLLAPLRRNGTFADRPQPRSLWHHAEAAAHHHFRAQRCRLEHANGESTRFSQNRRRCCRLGRARRLCIDGDGWRQESCGGDRRRFRRRHGGALFEALGRAERQRHAD